MLCWRTKIIRDNNKMFAKICKVNNSEYLQKIDIYSNDLKNIYITIFTPLDFSLLALSNHPKINTTN